MTGGRGVGWGWTFWVSTPVWLDARRITARCFSRLLKNQALDGESGRPKKTRMPVRIVTAP